MKILLKIFNSIYKFRIKQIFLHLRYHLLKPHLYIYIDYINRDFSQFGPKIELSF